jgi:S1-C subfamily serine protease
MIIDAACLVTNYHVVRNSKVAQVALITPNKGKYSVNDPLMPTTKQVMDDQPPQADVFPFLSSGPSSSTSTSSSTSSRSNILPYSSMRPSNDSTQYRRRVYKATVVGVDPGKDVAVLKIDAPIQELFPINVGTSTGLRVGQGALAIGNPFGLDHTLTSGIISGIGREVKSPIGRPISNVIQTDAAINPGL